MSDLAIINPATGASIANLHVDDMASIQAKHLAAIQAQRHWAQRPYAERAGVVARFRELLDSRREHLATLLTSEVGKPIQQARGELKGCLARVDFFLEKTPAILADEVVFDDGSMRESITMEPLGVIALVSAWNYPYFVGLNVLIPALLTGNAVVYKPSEYSTLSGLEALKLFEESGLPRDVLQVVVGGGHVGAEVLDRRFSGYFFTGSHRVGQAVAAAAGRHMARVQLELGGKDPVYVMPDADPAKAAAAIADGAFYNTGQSCCAVERVYVHEKIHDAFVEAFTAEVRGFVLGDPMEDATYVGPLTRRNLQVSVLTAQIHEAKEKGGRVLLGGNSVNRPGFYFEPTVVDRVSADMSLMRDESFGPVIGIAKVKSDDEAIAAMNDTEYGLTASVYGQDIARAEAILGELDVGTAYVNCCDRVSPRLPWSGRRNSGVGVTLSTHGIRALVQPKAWHIRK